MDKSQPPRGVPQFKMRPKPTIPLRDPSEIQQVHDMLVAIYNKEIDLGIRTGTDDYLILNVALHCLCWVLEHDHGENDVPDFADLLDWYKDRIKEEGGVMVTEYDQPIGPKDRNKARPRKVIFHG